MIERGGGRTSGLTDWQLMDVNSMWACLQDHDTTNHWRQVAGWRKVCDLAQTHLGRLQEYRRGLAEAWPPETSGASRAYLAQLDELIDKVRHTHDAAAANYTALSAAAQAIGSTRAELRKIHEEYAGKLQQKQAYEATAADPKAVMGSRITESPVTDAELERLNVQARGMMFGLSGELQQAQATLRQPPPAPPRPRRDPSSTDPYEAGTAPTIPPIAPVPIAVSSANQSTPKPLGPPSQPPQAPQGVGPVLGGAGIGLAPTPNSPASPGPTTAGSLGQSPIPGPPPALPSVSNTRPRIAGPPQGISGAIDQPGGRSATGAPHAQPPSAPIRAMAPGGLIGGTPGAGFGQPSAGTSPTRRVNPVGGVIGGGGAGTAPTGGAGSRPGGGRGASGGHASPPTGGAFGLGGTAGMGPGLSPSLGNLGRERKDGERPHWDPENPWETEQGVKPVVLPPDEDGPTDPGPAIGLNR